MLYLISKNAARKILSDLMRQQQNLKLKINVIQVSQLHKKELHR